MAASKKYNDKRDSYIEPFKAEFKQAVLHHIHHGLGKNAWARLRQIAKDRRRSRFCDIKTPPEISPEDLIDLALEEVGLSVNEIMTHDVNGNAITIATIEGQPVYFILRMGIYLWGKHPASRLTLHFFATFPVYPPGW